jgi:acyl-CoA thioesterase FadM
MQVAQAAAASPVAPQAGLFDRAVPSFIACRWDHIADDPGYTKALLSFAEFGRTHWYRWLNKVHSERQLAPPYLLPVSHELSIQPGRRPGLGEVVVVENRVIKVGARSITMLAEVRAVDATRHLFARVRTVRVNPAKEPWVLPEAFHGSVDPQMDASRDLGPWSQPWPAEPDAAGACGRASLSIRASDCDALGHVNNCMYPQIFSVTEQGEDRPGTASMLIEYIGEVKPGAVLDISFWDVAGDVRCKIARDAATGQIRARCLLQTRGPKQTLYQKGRVRGAPRLLLLTRLGGGMQPVPVSDQVLALASRLFSQVGPTCLSLHVPWEVRVRASGGGARD